MSEAWSVRVGRMWLGVDFGLPILYAVSTRRTQMGKAVRLPRFVRVAYRSACVLVGVPSRVDVLTQW